jgi:hypothetical protein
MENEIQDSIISSLFIPEHCGNAMLIVHAGKSDISVTVYDTARQSFVAFENHLIPGSGTNDMMGNPAHVLINSQLLLHEYQTKQLIWEQPLTTLIPASLYEETKKEQMLFFNHAVDTHPIVMSEKLKNTDSFNVFGLPENNYYYFQNRNYRIHHHASVFIESLAIQHKLNIADQQVYLHIGSGFFDFMLFQERKLKYYNTFVFNSSEDFIYYLLFAMEQLSLNPDAAQVHLSGEIIEDSALYHMLFKYVRFPKFMEKPSGINLAEELSVLPYYRYINLFNFILCEL